MSEDNITGLFRCIVAQAHNEGQENAFLAAANHVADLYRDIDNLPISVVKERLDWLRAEFEVQANRSHREAHTAKRRMQQAGMILRDDTTPR